MVVCVLHVYKQTMIAGLFKNKTEGIHSESSQLAISLPLFRRIGIRNKIILWKDFPSKTSWYGAFLKHNSIYTFMDFSTSALKKKKSQIIASALHQKY